MRVLCFETPQQVFHFKQKSCCQVHRKRDLELLFLRERVWGTRQKIIIINTKVSELVTRWRWRWKHTYTHRREKELEVKLTLRAVENDWTSQPAKYYERGVSSGGAAKLSPPPFPPLKKSPSWKLRILFLFFLEKSKRVSFISYLNMYCQYIALGVIIGVRTRNKGREFLMKW